MLGSCPWLLSFSVTRRTHETHGRRRILELCKTIGCVSLRKALSQASTPHHRVTEQLLKRNKRSVRSRTPPGDLTDRVRFFPGFEGEARNARVRFIVVRSSRRQHQAAEMHHLFNTHKTTYTAVVLQSETDLLSRYLESHCSSSFSLDEISALLARLPPLSSREIGRKCR